MWHILGVGSSSHDVVSRPNRWRKCWKIVKEFVNEIFSAKHRFNEDERNETLRRVFEHDRLQSLLLYYA